MMKIFCASLLPRWTVRGAQCSPRHIMAEGWRAEELFGQAEFAQPNESASRGKDRAFRADAPAKLTRRGRGRRGDELVVDQSRPKCTELHFAAC